MKRVLSIFILAALFVAVCGVQAYVPDPADSCCFQSGHGFSKVLVPRDLSGGIICRNDPINRIDPDGEWAEAVVEIASIGIGIKSLVENVSAGNWGSAAIDAGGLVVDGVCMAVPALPGVASAGIKTVRGSNKIDDAVDIVKNADKVIDSAKNLKKTKRVPSKQLRKKWEKSTGKKWPKDAKTGRNQDVAHKKALADGGTNDLDNIEPKPHDIHMDEHKAAGDFKRWGRRRRQQE